MDNKERMDELYTMITCVKGLVDIDHNQVKSLAAMINLLNERIDLCKGWMEEQSKINDTAFTLIAVQQAQIEKLEERLKELEAK